MMRPLVLSPATGAVKLVREFTVGSLRLRVIIMTLSVLASVLDVPVVGFVSEHQVVPYWKSVGARSGAEGGVELVGLPSAASGGGGLFAAQVERACARVLVS